MGRKILERLFYEGIMPGEKCCPRKKEYRQAGRACETAENALAEQLTAEQIKLFENYKNCAGALALMENGEHFVQGMALGVRITAEAFTLEYET